MLSVSSVETPVAPPSLARPARSGAAALVLTSAFALLAGCSDIASLVDPSRDDVKTLALTAASTTVAVSDSTTVTVQAKKEDGSPAKDGTEIEVTTTRGQLEPTKVKTKAGSASLTFRAGPEAGAALLQATSGSARAELGITVTSAPPPPPPPPPTTPAVIWLDYDVSGWAETSTITSVTIDGSSICIEHTKAGQWPVAHGVEGNPWVFANVGGQWYAATYEWLRPGQICKGITADNIGAHIGRSPLTSWRPQSGELVGFMVSALVRAGPETVPERSNLVMVRWP